MDPHLGNDLLFSTTWPWHSNSEFKGPALKCQVILYGISYYAIRESQKSLAYIHFTPRVYCVNLKHLDFLYLSLSKGIAYSCTFCYPLVIHYDADSTTAA